MSGEGSASHIGIVAVSAQGASLCYRTICEEAPALLGRHAHPELTMHTYPLAEYMRHIEADRWDRVGEMLLASAQKLKHAGAQLLLCPDNTVHQAIDLIRERAPLPWLHIAEEVADVAQARGHRHLLVLGTKYLMEGPVYRRQLERRGIAFEIPAPAARARINGFIFDELVNGQFEETTRRAFSEIIADGKARGADAVVLGCTEIPMLVGQRDSALPILDSTRTLARAALRAAVNAASTT